jgi:hypothetical protein
MSPTFEFLADHDKPAAKLSVILLDWNVRESFHSLHYLNEQTVDRSLYELIWIEFYERKPQVLMDAVRESEAAGRPIVDKLVVMNHPRDVIFHKHRMYNLGIVLAEGEICVICDSDAMFSPTFIEKVLAAFQEHPQSVVHLDEVRSSDREFYPFNYPAISEVLAGHCPNWNGRTTSGVANSKDMLHEANYGACLAARRSDIIRVGGADEHLDYLGYICGPYDLTFRLVNAGCQERWLTDEFLYHTWHPGESGINIDYHGPSDGRGMSLRSLAVRETGDVEPGLENGAIQTLRVNPRLDRIAALAFLQSPADDEWQASIRVGNDTGEKPRLVQKAYRKSFDVYAAGGCWYGILSSGEAFDPQKCKAGCYSVCLRAQARDELERMMNVYVRREFFRQFVKGSVQYSQDLRALPVEVAQGCFQIVLHQAKAWLTAAGCEFNLPYDPVGKAPQLVRRRYLQHNVVHYRGGFYGISYEQGAFEPLLISSEQGCPYLCGSSIEEVKSQIRAVPRPPRPRRTWNWPNAATLRRAARLVRPYVPDILMAALRGRRQDPEVIERAAATAVGTDADVIELLHQRANRELHRAA